jgi:hypothetical protein
MWHQKTKTEALLDSGATHNFMDKQAIQSLGLGTQVLPQALQINNVDGTINKEGSVTEYCNLWVQQGEQTIKMGFYIVTPRWAFVRLGLYEEWMQLLVLSFDTRTLGIVTLGPPGVWEGVVALPPIWRDSRWIRRERWEKRYNEYKARDERLREAAKEMRETGWRLKEDQNEVFWSWLVDLNTS